MDMTPDHVNLIDCHSEPLINEDLVEMTKSASEEEEEEGLTSLCNTAKDLQRYGRTTIWSELGTSAI